MVRTRLQGKNYITKTHLGQMQAAGYVIRWNLVMIWLDLLLQGSQHEREAECRDYRQKNISRQSIVDPDAFVVNGFPSGLMVPNLDETLIRCPN